MLHNKLFRIALVAGGAETPSGTAQVDFADGSFIEQSHQPGCASRLDFQPCAAGADRVVVFRRALAGLGLPIGRIVLQLPGARAAPHCLLERVAANYRRSGFRIALNAAHAAEGLRLVGRSNSMRSSSMHAKSPMPTRSKLWPRHAQRAASRWCSSVSSRARWPWRCRARPYALRAGLAQGRAWGAPHSLLGAEAAAMHGARGHDDGRGCGCMHAADA